MVVLLPNVECWVVGRGPTTGQHLVVQVRVAALDVVRVVLVDGVVAQVHARVPQVLPRVVVLHRRKPDKFLL